MEKKKYMDTPLWDNRLPVEERLDFLVQELTLEEKIHCLTTSCPRVERLGIEATYMGGEAAHGIEARHDQAFNAGEPEYTTSLTQPIGMSGSFDRDLIRECGRVVGEEARALYGRHPNGGLCRWAPTVDMERDPRWGRTEEAYGEDPCLAGEMSAAYIGGMRGSDPFYIQCGATLKHFYANNVEKDRIKISSSLDERNKWEYYFEPFRRAIEGGAEAVMTSYNEINGVPSIVNSEVQRVLKDTFGLPGHVVCDGGDFQQTVNDHGYFKAHAETLAYGLKAGVDGFTDNGEVVYAAAREALEKGLITEEDIDRSVRNSFRTRIRLGFFDAEGACPYRDMGESYINNENHKKVSLQMAQESIVLLKNEEDLLPLAAAQGESVAVIGPLADVWYKDWYGGLPPYHVTPYEGICRAYPSANMHMCDGLSLIRLKGSGEWEERYVGLDGESRLCMVEKDSAETFILTDWGCGGATLRALSNGKLVTLEEKGCQIRAAKDEAFSWFIREAWHFQAAGDESGQREYAAVSADTPATQGISAAASVGAKHDFITAGAYTVESWNGRRVACDSDGHLAIIREGAPAVGESDADPGAADYALGGGESAVLTVELVRDGLAAAEELARASDHTILILGSNPVINSKEEIDRTTLALPPFQEELAERVLAADPKAVVVLITNYPYAAASLTGKACAVLYSASGSQELGSAIASVISGRYTPAGRLPMTWYADDADLPDMSDYDIVKGERTYQYYTGKPLFPFGYGLSYTKFEYHTLACGKKENGLQITLSVTNCGKAASDEVVQLYVRKEGSRVKRPLRQLKAFERVRHLMPGEKREVRFFVEYRELRYYDVVRGRLVLEDGVYVIEAGASSQDIRRTLRIEIDGETAVMRDPFVWTAAVQYDDYEHCFLHRGNKKHMQINDACVMPGAAGDDLRRMGNDAKGSVLYRSMQFKKKPRAFCAALRALQPGKLTLFCESEGRTGERVSAAPEISPDQEFETITIALPDGFVPDMRDCQLMIEMEGQLQLVRWHFE